ncbi:MAG: DUF1513 domain-containing protein [Burkholderiaceae bacterium]
MTDDVHASQDDARVRNDAAPDRVARERRRLSWIAAGVLSLTGCNALPIRSTTASSSEYRASGRSGSDVVARSTMPAPAPPQVDIVSGCRLVDGRMGVARVAADGSVRWVRPLPSRVHEIVVDAARACLHVIARRPGRERWRLSVVDGGLLERGDSGPEHVFCGHGIVTADGLLFTTEAHLVDGAGSIAVRETVGGRLLTRYDTGGFDPHMIAAMPDGDTVVVAIGGARENEGGVAEGAGAVSPDSSLAYFDRRDGRCLGRYEAWHPMLSIRHLAVAPDGRVVFGSQWRGAEQSLDPTVPLLGSHRGTGSPRPVLGDPAQWRALRGYVGSVVVSDDGAMAWASSPRGGRVVSWPVDKNRLDVDDRRLHDVCGLAGRPGTTEPLLSTGDGLLILRNEGRASTAASALVGSWDNHMATLVKASGGPRAM